MKLQQAPVDRDLEKAVALLRDRQASLAIVAGGEVLALSHGHGVAPLLHTVERLGVERLQGAALADKVVGRAVALVAAYAGVAAVHGEWMSPAAMAELDRQGIPFTYGVEIPQILNQRGDALCPFEELVKPSQTPQEAVGRLRAALEKAMGHHAAPPAGVATPHGGSPRPLGSTSTPARRLTWAGLWLALAVVVPQAFHLVGAGPALLPMHLPVLLAGALSGPLIGAVVGALAPWLSHLVTGMPPLVPPVAPLMGFELAAYGAVAGWMRRKLVGQRPSTSPWWWEFGWLVPAMVAGRLALAAAAFLVGPALGLRVPPTAYVTGALVTGLPGMALQLAALPPLVHRLARR